MHLTSLATTELSPIARFHSPLSCIGFQALLTLFPKSFSNFPHGTCSLSVSSSYLALDGAYHPIRATLPSSSTLGSAYSKQALIILQGCHLLWPTVPGKFGQQAPTDKRSLAYNSTPELTEADSGWAHPISLAVTTGILVNFFSSP